jgi:F0F1-type ATP synthase gamma subunit
MEKEEITLLARSETDQPFTVTFTKNEDKLTITCTCSEGIHGEFCEHKLRLASNDIMMLQHPGQNSAMLSVHVWVIDAPISDKLINLLQLQGEDEQDEEAIEKAQAEIGKAMREGTV